MTDACLPQRPGPARRDASSQRGSVLVWAAFVILMVLGVIASGTSFDQAHDALASAEFAGGGQARAVAEAGPGGRVSPGSAASRCSRCPAFLPRRDLAASPPVNETDDAAAGPGAPSTRSRRASGGAISCASRPLTEPFTDADGDGRYDAGEYLHRCQRDRPPGRGARGARRDGTGAGSPGTGAVWLIESRGLPLPTGLAADLPLTTQPNGLRASATRGQRGPPDDHRPAVSRRRSAPSPARPSPSARAGA